MAATVAQTSQHVPGADLVRRITVTGDNAYPTGGWDLFTLFQTGTIFRNIVRIRRVDECRPNNIVSGKWIPVLISTYSNGFLTALKLAIVLSTTGAEIANGVDLSTGQWHMSIESE